MKFPRLWVLDTPRSHLHIPKNLSPRAQVQLQLPALLRSEVFHPPQRLRRAALAAAPKLPQQLLQLPEAASFTAAGIGEVLEASRSGSDSAVVVWGGS